METLSEELGDEAYAELVKHFLSLSVSSSLATLWTNGLQGDALTKDAGSDSTRTAKNEPAPFVDGTFNVLADLDAMVVSRLAMRKTISASIAHLGTMRGTFANEREIATFVRCVLQDVVLICGLGESVRVREEAGLHNVGEPDLWVVEVDGTPILVVEVKSPRRSVLRNAKVGGQCHDYITALASFSGCRALGIVTTGEEWRVVWLEHEEELAASPSIDVGASAAPSPARRLVRASPVLSRTDPYMLRVLASAVLKAARSPRAASRLVGPERKYVCDDSSRWRWRSAAAPDAGALFNLNFDGVITIPEPPSEHVVMRFFQHGVFLAVLTSSLTLYVVKPVVVADHNPVANVDAEAEAWRTVWNVPVKSATVAGRPALVLPVVMTCVEASGEWSFRTDAASLLAPWAAGSLTDSDRALAEPLFAELRAAVADWTPRAALLAAARAMATKGYSHDDLAWRHVGLLPVQDQADGRAGEIAARPVTLRPVLIDLGRVTRHTSAAAAWAAMIGGIAELVPDENLDFMPLA